MWTLAGSQLAQLCTTLSHAECDIGCQPCCSCSPAVTMTVHYTMAASGPLAVCVLQIPTLQEVLHEHSPAVSTVPILLV